jgi:hypothetical protein
MGAKSNNKHDVFEWIKQVIDSCETARHDIVCDKLIVNFHKMYGDEVMVSDLQMYQILKEE